MTFLEELEELAIDPDPVDAEVEDESSPPEPAVGPWYLVLGTWFTAPQGR